MKYNRQNLVNAQVNISRANWMANRGGECPPKIVDEDYVVKNIQEAIKELQLAIGVIEKPSKNKKP